MLAYVNFDMVGRVKEGRLTLQSVGSSGVWPRLIEQTNVVLGMDFLLEEPVGNPDAPLPEYIARHLIDGNSDQVIASQEAFELGLLPWAFVSRQDLAESAITRRLLSGGIMAMTGMLALEHASMLLRLPAQTTQVLWPLTWFLVSGMLTVTVDRRIAPMTLGFLGTLFVAAHYPHLRFYAMSGSNLIMTVNMVFLFTPQ